jgi:hypothetical protein
MTESVDHVFPEVAALLAAPDHQRIRVLHEEKWVSYPRAKQALDTMERIFNYPPRKRMPCLLIQGRSGMGKTMIVEKFCRNHQASFERAIMRERTPVLALTMRPRPTLRRFFAQILSTLNAPVFGAMSTIVLEDRAYNLMLALEVRILIVDEVHNVFTAAKANDRDVMMALLRVLVGELKIPLVCAGTDEAENAMLGDEQLASRYERLQLPSWKADADFQGLVGSALRAMPLRRPSVVDPMAIRHLVDISDGVTARIFRVLADLGEDAIVSGAERITSAAIMDVPIAPKAAAA